MKIRTRQQSGQALVEFAIALPLLISLLLGSAYFGFLLYAHVQVTNAAREGARAGSLYLGGRFHYTSCQTGQPCRSLFGYGDGGNNPACWSLRDWVETALVERNRLANGCDDTGYNTTVHSLGLLNPTVCPDANSGTNCWWLFDPTSNGVVITNNAASSAQILSVPPGAPIEVRVRYRFPRPIVADYIGFTQDPILIDKTVIMKLQNN